MPEGIIAIDTPKHDFKNIRDAIDWAKTNIVGIYHNDDTGEDIRISKLAIGKYLSKKAVEQSTSIDAHLSVLKQMPSLIKAALLKERTADKENNIDIKEIRRLYGEIRYENQIYSVKITVKVYKTEVSKAYSYEVIDMKNPADKRQGSFCPLSYIEDLTPPTDGKIPNPDFLSVAASLPAPEPRQPVAEKRSTDFFQSGQRKQYASSSTHSDISNGKDTTSFQIIKYKRPNFQKK